jgi:HK97 family phage major capsid protein/HK97 family phage prohead protease
MDRGYSVLTIRAVDNERREIVGTANTVAVDRFGTVIEPRGAVFDLPMPLLWQHDKLQPVGNVVEAKVTNDGIRIRAQFGKVEEPGPLRDRVELAWQSVKAGLVRGLSVGFNTLERDGIRILRWLWAETSVVTIPGNAEATIESVRSAVHSILNLTDDSAPPALPGTEAARVVRSLPADASAKPSITHRGSMNTQEQIRQAEATRAARHAQAKLVTDAAATDGLRTLTSEEQETVDTALADIRSLDTHIKTLRDLERLSVVQAVAVAGQSADQSMQVRSGAAFTPGRPNMPKGTAFMRYAMALANSRGSLSDALRFAQRWKDSTPEVLQVLEQRANPGITTDSDFAAPLVIPMNLASEFIELLRASTILGRLNFRKVPFNVKIPVQTSGSLVNWVAEAGVKPVGEVHFDTLTMGYSKVAGIVVISEELARLSSPSAEDTVRRDLVAAISEFIDQQMLSESVAAATGVPAGLPRGVTPIPATGTDAAAVRCDVRNALAAMLGANLSTSGVVIVMSETMGATLGLMTNALGQPEFPSLGAQGGTLAGLPVITSENIESDTTGENIYFIKQSEILLADDGGVTLDSSREATLDMAGSTTPNYSLWQRNMIGLRAERWINYQKRRAGAVQWIQNAAYSTCGT